jgi:large subunit ribosomal protein L24
MKRIKTGDVVKVISGANKGKTGKVVRVAPKDGVAYVDGIGMKVRHVKPTKLNPKGGKKDIHVGINLSKLAVVDEAKSAKGVTTKKEIKK